MSTGELTSGGPDARRRQERRAGPCRCSTCWTRHVVESDPAGDLGEVYAEWAGLPEHVDEPPPQRHLSAAYREGRPFAAQTVESVLAPPAEGEQCHHIGVVLNGRCSRCGRPWAEVIDKVWLGAPRGGRDA
jgi:hypothetical protein